MNFDDIIDDNFTVKDIEVSIRKFKSNKACGIDGLQSEQVWWSIPHVMSD